MENYFSLLEEFHETGHHRQRHCLAYGICIHAAMASGLCLPDIGRNMDICACRRLWPVYSSSFGRLPDSPGSHGKPSRQPAVRIRNRDLFEPPLLLIKGSTSSNFRIVATICYKDIVFTDSAFAIKSYKSKEILECILGIITSQLATYFILITGSSIGVEREQIFSKELYYFPVTLDNEIISIAPLMITNVPFGFNLKKIEFIGRPDSDYHEFLIPPMKKMRKIIFRSFNK